MVVGADTGSQLVSILTDFGASVTMIEASPDVVTALCTRGATRRATAVHALLWGTTSFLLPGSRRTFGRVAKKKPAWRLTARDAGLLSGYCRL